MTSYTLLIIKYCGWSCVAIRNIFFARPLKKSRVGRGCKYAIGLVGVLDLH